MRGGRARAGFRDAQRPGPIPEADIAAIVRPGNPPAAVKELGGTGRVHDWGISRRIRDAVELPVFLAGGLCPANVVDAIDAVEPYDVDVCSGVRTGGALDAAVLRDFMRAARGESKRAPGG